MIRNFLFDLYGTLVDIRTDEWCEDFWNRIAEMLGRTDIQYIKGRYEVLCREPLPDGAELDLMYVFSHLLTELGGTMDPSEFATRFRAASILKLRLFEGAKGLLDGLHKRGTKVYLLSNAQACFTYHELEKLGLLEKFDGIMLSSEIGWKKPSEHFFKAAFERFDLLPQECIYIGNDLRDDIAGARSVGMRSIYIETEQSRHYKETIPLDMSVGDHQELKELLFRIAAES